ncbi:hypothetical protein CY34DRAFT_592903 [Suillus luteus UH-Slu-Lm8-n1]|uniref:Unplaced genomic scaffold CY34scaffold_518, whole genome shotgun sequence n=1 Tax=Suillus luteus UH-Slu-Lm8-n1 TaxID=930992 RepID=A0A0D0AAT8_9AGAM|nr:hypothetical protein CY34DRAFT_592903 [Suillus luteus UH-Slu-Lm8-n1]
MGDAFSYADTIIACWLMTVNECYRRMNGPGSVLGIGRNGPKSLQMSSRSVQSASEFLKTRACVASRLKPSPSQSAPSQLTLVQCTGAGTVKEPYFSWAVGS